MALGFKQDDGGRAEARPTREQLDAEAERLQYADHHDRVAKGAFDSRRIERDRVGREAKYVQLLRRHVREYKRDLADRGYDWGGERGEKS